jgi:hypothetical protein
LRDVTHVPTVAGRDVTSQPDAADAGVARDDRWFFAAEEHIRDEYRAYLEDELARLQSVIRETDVAFHALVEAFDEKERYIDSLLSVRAKKWIVGRLPKRPS